MTSLEDRLAGVVQHHEFGIQDAASGQRGDGLTTLR
jgi:hypothetical protein